MSDQNVEMLLAHLKQSIIKFEAGYASLTEARAELHKVANNFNLKSIPLPETYTPKETEEATFEVVLRPNNTGSKLKASGLIEGTNYRVLLFEGTKEGTLMQGSVVPNDAPDGAELKDISMGYACVKANKAGDGYELSLKFTQLDEWFNGNMEKVVSDNPKAPAFKALMHKGGNGRAAVANNPLLNVLQQLDVPEAAKAANVESNGFFAEQATVEVVPVAPATPDLSDLFNKTLEDISPPVQQPTKPDPVADLFATTAKVPDMQVPSWLLS